MKRRNPKAGVVTRFLVKTDSSNLIREIEGHDGFMSEHEGVLCFDEKSRPIGRHNLYQVSRGLFETIKRKHADGDYVHAEFFRSTTLRGDRLRPKQWAPEKEPKKASSPSVALMSGTQLLAMSEQPPRKKKGPLVRTRAPYLF